MKKRIVLKKGRIILTREGKFVTNLSYKIIQEIKPFCKRIQAVGSVRRKEKNPADIDIVLIPKDRIKLEDFMRNKFKFIQGGEHKSSWRIEGVQTELYYADNDNFGAMLLAYSSRFGAGIGLRVIAKSKGLKLNQYGLFDRNGEKIAGKTEKEIYHSLGRKWKKPEDR
jgi:DNA polymerase (family X)